MASKYAGLKGKIPRQQTVRGEALEKEIARRKADTLADLTVAYNKVVEKAAGLAAQVAALSVEKEAIDIVIREKLDALEGDAVRMNGFTWSEKPEPYPVCDDPAQIVEYFKTHGMEEQLALNNSELAERLKKFVKEEALAGELKIETEPDPETGEERTVVRSQIPGVRVFLKSSLSRVKSKGAE